MSRHGRAERSRRWTRAAIERTKRSVERFIAARVGAYIAAAYWFTASTSFANPAVTFARMGSDSFAGIAPISAPAFIAAQLAGLAIVLAASRLTQSASTGAR